MLIVLQRLLSGTVKGRETMIAEGGLHQGVVVGPCGSLWTEIGLTTGTEAMTERERVIEKEQLIDIEALTETGALTGRGLTTGVLTEGVAGLAGKGLLS